VPEGWHELDEGAELWAGQNPHLFWVEDVEVPPSGLISKFVAIAGGTYSEAIGGANLLNLADVYFLYVSEDGLRAERLETQGHQPDKMMGSASAWCPDREVLVVFGGGTVVASSDRTFVLRGVLQETRRWQQLERNGANPSARQGVSGCIAGDRFHVFGGREMGGECRNDVWALDLEEERWEEVQCSGTAPLARVWYSAVQMPRSWIVFNGSAWELEPIQDDLASEYRTPYVLDFETYSWSSLPPPPPGRPVWVAAKPVAISATEILVLGGYMPHERGIIPPEQNQMAGWEEWYKSMMEPEILNVDGTWTARNARVSDMPWDTWPTHDDILRRSHVSAAFCRARNSVLVFGGSRCFTGEYYHDAVELRLTEIPAAERRARALLAQPELQAPRRRYARGHLGRLRGLARHHLVDPEVIAHVMAPP
jgi:hypothetical protein